MKITVIPVTPFRQNCSLLVCEKTGHAALVDPGGEVERIEQALEEQKATLAKIFITHAHLDHCGGALEMSQRYQVPIEGPHQADQFWLDLLPQQSSMFKFPEAQTFTPQRWLTDGDRVQFGAEELEVYHCPGHTPGHVVFFSRAHRLALVGDVLFAGTIGRTDFPQGNHADLVNSIRQKLWPLGDDVTFFPGHGRISSFGQERLTNPHVADGVNV